MANAVDRALIHGIETPNKNAIFTLRDGSVSFSELFQKAAAIQSTLRARGVKAGEYALVVDLPGPVLYATVLALLGMGVGILLVEPWLPASQIEDIVRQTSPKIFLWNWVGKIWGMRVGAIRKIPIWLATREAVREGQGPKTVLDFVCEPLPDSAHGIVSFTSGTTGRPKGVVRTHGYLRDVQDLLIRTIEGENSERRIMTAPDLCIFPNLALLNLATGRGSVLVPHSWSLRALKKIHELPLGLRPESLVAGPAFMTHLMESRFDFSFLQSIVVGGALSDLSIFEKMVSRWKEARLIHVYGGSEAEPVVFSSVQESLQNSREWGWFQALFLGKPLPEVSLQAEKEGLWVSGPNVCPEYLATDPEENLRHKKRDADGRLWHQMGDRVVQGDSGWWYCGRSHQREQDFLLEQSIYSVIQSSACFIHRGESEELISVGELSRRQKQLIQTRFPEVARVISAKICRDRRHRARIDRKKTLNRAGIKQTE